MKNQFQASPLFYYGLFVFCGMLIFSPLSHAEKKHDRCAKIFSDLKKISHSKNKVLDLFRRSQNGKEFLKEQYKKYNIQTPEMHFVLGSGISPALDSLGKNLSNLWEEKFSLSFSSVPGLKVPTSNTHQGLYRYFVHRQTGKSVCFQCGRLHGYEGYSPSSVIRPVMEPFLSGTKKFILTNIGGSLKEDVPIGTVIALKDHVNFTGRNPLIGSNPKDYEGRPLGPRFPYMEEVYNKKTRRKIIKDLRSAGLAVQEGTYICVMGPSLETPAEIKLFAKWGLDVVGMSTVWEAIGLKHAGAEVTGFSMVSNPGSGLKGSNITEEDMLALVKVNGEKMLQGFLCFCDREFNKNKKSI